MLRELPLVIVDGKVGVVDGEVGVFYLRERACRLVGHQWNQSQKMMDLQIDMVHVK